MATRGEGPDLSHLSGGEVAKVADALSSANLRLLIANKDDIIGLKTDELSKLAELASAARSNCGGFGCG